MIKGEYFLTQEDVLNLTNRGFDIFQYYLGAVKKCMPRPWGHTENKPSFGVYYYPVEDRWMWKDLAKEEVGNPIELVMRMFRLTWKQAIDKICYDFGFIEGNPTPVSVTWDKPNLDVDYCDIRFSSQPFQKRHHDFWNVVECSEGHVNRYNCWAVKDAAINRKKVYIGKDEVVFAYVAPEEDAVKLYFPEREKGEKFRNNVSYHYLWNYHNLEKCDHLIVQKSVKDMIVTTMIDPCSSATQAEGVRIFNSVVVESINKITPNPWIWYGSDEDGVRKCKEITATHGWRYINTPRHLLPEINDTYSFVKKYGLKEMERFMREKGVI